VVALGLLPWVVADWITNPAEFATQAGSKWEQRLFWIQTLAGNWSPPDHIILSPWWFALSAILAIILNNGLVWVALLFVWRFIVNWRRTMRLSQAFAVRDQMNKQELFRLFGDDPETMDKIKRAFQVGEKRWESELTVIFGEPEAKRLREIMPQEVGL
jgi:hypothetical protein